MYAQRIRLRWTSNETFRCPRTALNFKGHNTHEFLLSSKQVLDLVPAARLFRERYMEEEGIPKGIQMRPDFRHRAVQHKMNGASLIASAELGDAMDEFCRRPGAEKKDTTYSIKTMILRFLSGESIGSEISQEDNLKNSQSIPYFLHRLYSMSTRRMSSTHDRDHVAAVWVDCPKYVLPLQYKTMGLALLLEDAVKQLEKNFGVSIATTVPAGLFGPQEPSFLWRPSLYLDEFSIKTTAESYGVISRCLHHYAITPDRKMPMIKKPTEEPRLKGRVRDYEEIFHEAITAAVFEFNVLAALHWSFGTIMELKKDYLSDQTRKLFSVASAQPFLRFQRLLLDRVQGPAARRKDKRDGSAISKAREAINLDRRDHEKWGDRPEVNHLEIVYGLICVVLGLDVRIARERGFRLMVDTGAHNSPPRLGMTRLNFASQDEVTSTSTFRTTDPWLGERLEEEEGLFEAIEVDIREEKPTYRVIGVWVPMAGFPAQYAEAYEFQHGQDAYLV